MIHELKTWPGPWQACRDGTKPFDIRRADRGYGVGDFVILREWTPPEDPTAEGSYTGSFAIFVVTYLAEGGAWGLPVDLVVLGIKFFHMGRVNPNSELGASVKRLAELGLAALNDEDRQEVEVTASLLDLSQEHQEIGGLCPCPTCSGNPEPGWPKGPRFSFN